MLLMQEPTRLVRERCWMCFLVVSSFNFNPQKSVVRFIVAKPADFFQTIVDWQLRIFWSAATKSTFQKLITFYISSILRWDFTACLKEMFRVFYYQLLLVLIFCLSSSKIVWNHQWRKVVWRMSPQSRSETLLRGLLPWHLWVWFLCWLWVSVYGCCCICTHL